MVAEQRILVLLLLRLAEQLVSSSVSCFYAAALAKPLV